GVAVYDNGVRRPLTTPANIGSDFITFGASASTLYGFGFGSGLQKMSVTPSGVTVVNSKSDNTTIVGDFKFDNGLMYLPFGQVYNPETATLVGTFTMTNGGFAQVEPDSSVGRVYFLTGNSAFSDSDTRTLTL